MKDGQKYIRLNVSDVFMLYTQRKDNMFGNFVKITGLVNNGKFENFEHIEKKRTYRFQSGILADVFYETVNSIMDYQDGLRNCIAPIDYKNKESNNPDYNWVESSPFIGPYLSRKIKGHTKEYDRDAELQKMRASHGYVAIAPHTQHIVLDTKQFTKNGIFYVYNLLIKPEDIESGYNPNGLATVEITSFVSENDADYYSQSSQLFKDVAILDSGIYNRYAPVNKKRMEMFATITANIKSDEK